jgi:hypothetical protein
LLGPADLKERAKFLGKKSLKFGPTSAVSYSVSGRRAVQQIGPAPVGLTLAMANGHNVRL